MVIAITGSRGFKDQGLVDKVLEEYKDVCSLIVHGGCENSADVLGQIFAEKNKIKTEVIRPDYNKYPPKAAPIIRNKEIVSKADLLIAFWNFESNGTKSTIEFARKRGVPIEIIKT